MADKIAYVKNNKLMTLEAFKEKNFGKRGTIERNALEAGYDNFKIDSTPKRIKLLIFISLIPNPPWCKIAKNQQFTQVPFRGFRGENTFWSGLKIVALIKTNDWK